MLQLLRKSQNNNIAIQEPSISAVTSEPLELRQTIAWIKDSLETSLGPFERKVANWLETIEVQEQLPDMEFPCVTFNAAHDEPKIYCDFDGDPEDALILAHECGHALQFVMAGKDFIPPILRETAAFLAELIFLEHARAQTHQLFSSWASIVSEDDQTFFGKECQKLITALNAPSHAYYYRANYPPARALAQKIIRRGNAQIALQVFHGGISLKKLLNS